MNYYKTESIVLRHKKMGERDKLVRLLTKDHGKINIKIRGVNKTKHKYGTNFDLFSMQHINFYRKTPSSLPILTAVKSLNTNYSITKTLAQYYAASMVSNIIDTLTFGKQEESINVFNLFQESLDYIKNEVFPNYVVTWFVFNFLTLTGYSILLDNCTTCKNKISLINTPIHLSPASGGIICTDCSNKNIAHKTLITHQIYKILLNTTSSYAIFRSFIEKLDNKNLNIIEKLTKTFILYHSYGKINLLKYTNW